MRKALSRRGYQIVAIQTSKRNQKLNTVDDKNNMTDLAKNHYGHLLCYTHLHFGKAECANTGIKDSVLKEKFVEAYNEFVETRHYGGEELQMQEQLDRINREEKELITLHVRGLITKADFEHDRKEIVAQRKAWEKKMQEYRSAYFKKGDLKTIEECDEELVSRVVRKVTILNWVVTFEFYNGVKISRSYTNGRGGNQKGWLEKKKRKEMEE